MWRKYRKPNSLEYGFAVVQTKCSHEHAKRYAKRQVNLVYQRRNTICNDNFEIGWKEKNEQLQPIDAIFNFQQTHSLHQSNITKCEEEQTFIIRSRDEFIHVAPIIIILFIQFKDNCIYFQIDELSEIVIEFHVNQMWSDLMKYMNDVRQIKIENDELRQSVWNYNFIERKFFFSKDHNSMIVWVSNYLLNAHHCNLTENILYQNVEWKNTWMLVMGTNTFAPYSMCYSRAARIILSLNVIPW